MSMSKQPGYMEYSRTNSGGVIYTNPEAPPDKRWLIEHPRFGDKYFSEHDDILKWTVEQIRERYNLMERGGDVVTDGSHCRWKIVEDDGLHQAWFIRG